MRALKLLSIVSTRWKKRAKSWNAKYQDESDRLVSVFNSQVNEPNVKWGKNQSIFYGHRPWTVIYWFFLFYLNWMLLQVSEAERTISEKNMFPFEIQREKKTIINSLFHLKRVHIFNNSEKLIINIALVTALHNAVGLSSSLSSLAPFFILENMYRVNRIYIWMVTNECVGEVRHTSIEGIRITQM